MDATPEEILQWNIRQLWSQLLILIEEEPKIAKKKEIENIKYGISIRIPIQYLTNEWYDLYPSNKTATVKGYGRHKLLDLLDEIEERETMIRTILLDNLQQNPLITPRIK